MVAVAAPTVGRALRLLEGEPGQAERENVGQHVAGVGKQGQRVGVQTARQLDQKHYERERQSAPQTGSRNH